MIIGAKAITRQNTAKATIAAAIRKSCIAFLSFSKTVPTHLRGVLVRREVCGAHTKLAAMVIALFAKLVSQHFGKS
jgi:hypothetical protein